MSPFQAALISLANPSSSSNRTIPSPPASNWLKAFNRRRPPSTAVAVFADHATAETAIKKLAQAGFEIKNLSIVGQGYHTDKKVTGFYNAGDRIKFWGSRGAYWGGLWGLLFGGIFIMTPVGGTVVVLGYLGAIVISAIENAVIVGGLSALGAALYSVGIPKNSFVEYEAAVKADKFLVMAHGTATEVARAKSVLGAAGPSSLDVHPGAKMAEATNIPAPAGA